MRFCTFLPWAGPNAEPSRLVRFAREVEAMGYTHVKMGEHLVYPRELRGSYPYSETASMPIDTEMDKLEMLTTFAFLAGQTTTLRFKSGVMVLPLRNPLQTAAEVATLDHLSTGRLELEVGIGWMRDEFDIMGVPFEERGKRTDEYLAILRSAFEGDGSFDGRYFQVPPLSFSPRPARRPFPFYFGCGRGPVALRRIARWGQGWTPVGVSLEEVHEALEALHRMLEEEGRGGEELVLEGLAGGVADGAGEAEADARLRRLERMGEIGFTDACVLADQWHEPSLEVILRRLEWFATSVMPRAGDI